MKNKCDCSQCENWSECEIGLIVHNPISINVLSRNNDNTISGWQLKDNDFKISKGDKVAQCTIAPHEGFLMGYESDVVRVSGFGSTGI